MSWVHVVRAAGLKATRRARSGVRTAKCGGDTLAEAEYPDKFYKVHASVNA